MKLIVFVGSPVSGYFIEDVVSEKPEDYEYIQIAPKVTIKATTLEIVQKFSGQGASPDYIVYDLEPYIEDAKEIANEIAGIAKSINATPIAYMAGFSPKSVMAQELYANDIKKFIYAGSAAELKEQFIKNVTNYYDVNPREEVYDLNQMHDAKTKVENFKSIGVAGTQRRIGTTTQAIQMVKYLQYKGYTACYVEQNENRYYDISHRNGSERSISFVQKTYEFSQQKGKNPNFVVEENVEMYCGQAALSDAKKTYDYYVYDYGDIFDRDFDRTAFMKDDIKILVGGVSANELDYLERGLTLPFYYAASVILSFADEKDQEAILKMVASGMKPEGIPFERPVAFANYVPNPYVFTNIEMFERLLPIEGKKNEEAEDKPVKKERKFFKRKKA